MQYLLLLTADPIKSKLIISNSINIPALALHEVWKIGFKLSSHAQWGYNSDPKLVGIMEVFYLIVSNDNLYRAFTFELDTEEDLLHIRFVPELKHNMVVTDSLIVLALVYLNRFLWSKVTDGTFELSDKCRKKSWKEITNLRYQLDLCRVGFWEMSYWAQ